MLWPQQQFDDAALTDAHASLGGLISFFEEAICIPISVQWTAARLSNHRLRRERQIKEYVMRSFIVTLASIAAAALPAPAAMARTGITKATPRRIALSLVKDGTVKSAKLEREHGTRVYSFDIVQPNNQASRNPSPSKKWKSSFTTPRDRSRRGRRRNEERCGTMSNPSPRLACLAKLYRCRVLGPCPACPVLAEEWTTDIATSGSEGCCRRHSSLSRLKLMSSELALASSINKCIRMT